MGKVLITEQYLTDIANAIRQKNGTVNTYAPPLMAAAILAIQGGSLTPNKITFNKTTLQNPTTGDIFFDIKSSIINAASSQSSTLIPNSYDDVDISYSTGSTKNLENMYSDTSSTTYGQFSMKTGAQAESWIYLLFDTTTLSSLLDYSLVSVSWKAAVTKQGNATDVTDAKVQLYNNDVALGEAQPLTTTTKTIVADSNLTGLTWADIPNLRLKISGQRTSSNVTYARYFYIYGAELILTYTTTPEYQTTLVTQKYNGTDWVPTSFTDCLDSNLIFQVQQ